MLKEILSLNYVDEIIISDGYGFGYGYGYGDGYGDGSVEDMADAGAEVLE